MNITHKKSTLFSKARKTASVLAVYGTLALISNSAQAIVYNVGAGSSDIPGLTGFATTGAMMSGMSVQAIFSGGTNQTLSWATTGLASGGVFGSGWGLSLAGDTFGANWNFTFSPTASLGQLTSLILSGNSGYTVFDRTAPSQGTPGSASGWDFTFTAGYTEDPQNPVTVTYSDMVGIGGNPAVSDLFHVVTVDFGTAGPRGNFSFIQDTDNDSRYGVPEPASLALMGLGLAGLAAARRRKQSV